MPCVRLVSTNNPAHIAGFETRCAVHSSNIYEAKNVVAQPTTAVLKEAFEVMPLLSFHEPGLYYSQPF